MNTTTKTMRSPSGRLITIEHGVATVGPPPVPRRMKEPTKDELRRQLENLKAELAEHEDDGWILWALLAAYTIGMLVGMWLS